MSGTQKIGVIDCWGRTVVLWGQHGSEFISHCSDNMEDTRDRSRNKYRLYRERRKLRDSGDREKQRNRQRLCRERKKISVQGDRQEDDSVARSEELLEQSCRRRIEDIREKNRNKQQLRREKRKRSALCLNGEGDLVGTDELSGNAEQVEVAPGDDPVYCLPCTTTPAPCRGCTGCQSIDDVVADERSHRELSNLMSLPVNGGRAACGDVDAVAGVEAENVVGFGDPVAQSVSTAESPKAVYVNDLMHAKLPCNNAKCFVDEAVMRSELCLERGQISVAKKLILRAIVCEDAFATNNYRNIGQCNEEMGLLYTVLSRCCYLNGDDLSEYFEAVNNIGRCWSGVDLDYTSSHRSLVVAMM